MRWDALFADLEGQFEAHEGAQFHADVADLTRAERASISLAARFMAAVGRPVTVTVTTGEHVAGAVADATAQWVLLTSAGAQVLIPAHAIAGVQGVPPVAAVISEVDRRVTLGHALRALSRDRVRVTVRTVAATASGTIDAVGADYLDVMTDVSGVRTLPFAAVVTVRSA